MINVLSLLRKWYIADVCVQQGMSHLDLRPCAFSLAPRRPLAIYHFKTRFDSK